MVKFARRPSVATQQRLILARINGCHTVVATHRVSGEVSVYAGRLNEQRDKSVWAWCVISAACARVYPAAQYGYRNSATSKSRRYARVTLTLSIRIRRNITLKHNKPKSRLP